MSLPNEKPQAQQELTSEQLEQVLGGAEEYVPTPECPTCASGVDPTVRDPLFGATLNSAL